MTSSWLEVIEPSASEKQVALWGADSLLMGMRIALDDPFVGRTSFSAGRAQRDDLKCGLAGSVNSVVTLTRGNVKWVAKAAAQTTTLHGKPIGTSGRPLVDGDEIDGGAVAFRYCTGPGDPVLGVAWRIGDFVLFGSSFFLGRPRWYRAISLQQNVPRLVTVLVEDHTTRRDDARGRVVHRWRNAELVTLNEDVDGPTLRALHERSKALGGEIDPAFLAAVCDGVDGAVESIDDVVVRFDGTIVSCSLSARLIGDNRARLRRILGTLGRNVGEDPAKTAALAGFVRALFPDEAARHDALVEELPLLDAEEWLARVPESPSVRAR